MRLAALLVAVASPAVANPFIAEGAPPDQLAPRIVNQCIDNGDDVIEATPMMVTCQATARQGPENAFLGNLLFGAVNGQQRLIYRFVIVPHAAGSRVRMQATLESDLRNGSTRRDDLTPAVSKHFRRTIAALGLVPESQLSASVPAK